MNKERDAGKPSTEQNTRTGDRREDHERPGERAADAEQRDPDSPGATIDSPTPAEPNEPG